MCLEHGPEQALRSGFENQRPVDGCEDSADSFRNTVRLRGWLAFIVDIARESMGTSWGNIASCALLYLPTLLSGQCLLHLEAYPIQDQGRHNVHFTFTAVRRFDDFPCLDSPLS